jgi:hypothetical protein
VGIVVGWLVRAALQPGFEVPSLRRENYRGVMVTTAAGIVVPFTALFVEGARSVFAAADIGSEITAARTLFLLAATAFGFLGLVDDLVGSGDARGFRGHLIELARGRMTTGGLKLVGGGAVALALVAAVDDSLGEVLAGGALIALAANLANQFDRRPGRVIKVGVVAFVVLAVATAAPRQLEGLAVVVGATAALLVDDLRERLMLGDVGANVLGACLGLGVVLTCSFTVVLSVLGVVATLNLVGEVSSFTRIIDAVPVLRAIDRAGRRDP